MKKLLLATLLPLCLASCGVGGGGGDGDGGSEFVGAARVSLTASPKSIDTRDRTQISVTIKNVIDTGVILKIRYPNKLSYAVNTAKLRLESEDDGRTIDPSFNGDNDDTTYLVFFLARSLFGDVPSGNEDVSEPATLKLELIGVDRLRDGKIEIDADVNDPTIDDAVEFDVNSPAFEAESEASIEVSESRN